MGESRTIMGVVFKRFKIQCGKEIELTWLQRAGPDGGMHMAARSFLLEMSKISLITQLKQQAVSYWRWGAEAG